MRVLNLYAGIGGNRKLWQDVDVTAVEYNEEIAGIYRDYFPNDTVIVGDAHQYLLDHYKEFDFIWSSPPCPTHSRARYWSSKGGKCSIKYPDMMLYQEIIFLQHYAECQWVIENVIPFYKPLIAPSFDLERHLFWSNFTVNERSYKGEYVDIQNMTANDTNYGFSLKGRNMKHRKDQILRNLVNPDLGLYILEQARGIVRQEKTAQLSIFKTGAA